MILQLYILFCLKGGSLPPFILGLLCAFSLLFLLLVRSLLARNFFISNGFVLRGPGMREKPFPRPLLFIPDPCFNRLISLAEPYTSHSYNHNELSWLGHYIEAFLIDHALWHQIRSNSFSWGATDRNQHPSSRIEEAEQSKGENTTTPYCVQ